MATKTKSRKRTFVGKPTDAIEFINGLSEDNCETFLDSMTSFEDFVKTGYFRFTANGHPLVVEEDGYLVLIDGNKVILLGSPGAGHSLESLKEEVHTQIRRAEDATIVGVIVPSLNKRNKFLFIKSGDTGLPEAEQYERYERQSPDDIDAFDSGLDSDQVCTVSFLCLGRFFDGGEMEGIEAVANRTLTLAAFEPDSEIPFSAKDKAAHKAWERNPKTNNLPKPPKPGYTMLKDVWHRAATAIFHPKGTKTTILIGFDEGSYFGCEVKGRLKTINEVYNALIPAEAKNFSARQGEWFFVPVKEKDLPPLNKCIALFRAEKTVSYDESAPDAYEGVALPVEDSDSSRHLVFSRESAECRIGADGRIYVFNPIMIHSRGQHAEIKASGWHTFVRNTAIRSYSIQGVD